MDMKVVVKENPILAILRGVPSKILINYAQAIMNGGIGFFEVALNGKDSLKQIYMLRNLLGDRCMVGAGTAVDTELCRAAVNAGAQFLLTPGTTDAVLQYCKTNNIDLLPGVLTPTDIMRCRNYGYKVMKLFPAGDMPMGYIKSIKGPFDDVDFVAVGGVSADNIAAFFQAGYSGVAMSGRLVPPEMLAGRDWQSCTNHVKAMLASIPGKQNN
jgi:2-dehydro-3-deoxyphosphogluconate aldolase/(4S)-4-hydroxy-2-oxoglutarate aldolase